MEKLLILNGPNLNLLGSREPDVYGSMTLDDIRTNCNSLIEDLGRYEMLFFQSNAEHELIGRIHRAPSEGVVFVIFNPGAFTHSSIALRDALLGVGIPFIEVHISNVFARVRFRHHSYLSDVAVGVISGLGTQGYELALLAADRILSNNT